MTVNPPAGSDATLQRFSAISLLGPEGVSAPGHFPELLRTSARLCRRLVDCETARIWIARRGGRRLVARDWPDGGGSPTEYRLARGEGLVGWVLSNHRALRLGEGDPRPALTGPVVSFRSAIVLPLYRRGEPFGAIECLDHRGGDFSNADFDRLEMASESLSFALDYALLYQEIERRALEKEVLLDVTRALSAPFDLDEVILAIFASLRQVVDFDASAIYLVNRDTHLLELAAEDGYPEGSDEAFGLQIGQGIVGWVAKTGEPVIVPDVTRDPRYVAARPATRSELAAPLVVEGRTIGVFNLESDHEDAYHDGHLELLTAFAAQAAVAVERARVAEDLVEQRRLEKELAIAREIQQSFLPAAPPTVPGFELAGASRTHDEVGGDYYDFISVSDTRVGLAIADVSGKGIPAALIMAGFRMSLLAEIRNEFAIRAVMRKVNSLLYESTERDRFVTAFYGVLDWRNRMLIFSNGGHNPPLLVRRDGPIETLSDGGLALGVLPDSRYEERPIALQTGDVLVMYTDGVTEAEDAHHEQFGVLRLERCIERNAEKSAASIMACIEQEVLEWAGEHGQNDDLTLLVVKVLEPPPEPVL